MPVVGCSSTIFHKFLKKLIKKESNYKYSYFIFTKIMGYPGTNTNSQNNQYIINRITLYNKISESDNPDDFLGFVNELHTPKLRSQQEALQIINTYPYLTQILTKLKNANLDALLAGSTALSALTTEAEFRPNDYDFYVKHINTDLLIKFEEILESIFEGFSMLVLRNVLTMTWIFFKDQQEIHKIQCNILHTDSWAQTMVSYHCDLTCVGFEVLTEKFVYLKGRFDQEIDKDLHYFSDIINLDTTISLQRAVDKYTKRGFNCKAIFVAGREDNIFFSFSTEEDSEEDEDEPIGILDYLEKYYRKINNITYANSCQELFPDDFVPHILDIWKLKTEPQFVDFIQMPSNIVQSYGKPCGETGKMETVLIECSECKRLYNLIHHMVHINNDNYGCPYADFGDHEEDYDSNLKIYSKEKIVPTDEHNLVIKI